LQTALAAGVSWTIAKHVLGHPNPFFAPVSSIIALGITLGQRTRRAIELVLGVAVGIAVADLLVRGIGHGAGQIALTVLLVMAAAVFMGGGTLLVTQAAISAVLVATLKPMAGVSSFDRFYDALVGGGVALAVNSLVFPIDPRKLVRGAAAPVLAELAHVLDDIGQALARRAMAFDMRVCAVRRQGQAETPSGLLFVGGPERLDDVLRLADCLAVTLPLSPATCGLIDDRRLRLMKPTAFLVNVARAEVIDEVALYDTLASGRLAGAALDVWYRYPTSAEPTPPATQPFHELGNVLMTPHVSGWTEGMLDARGALIAENIERTARGEPPLNLIGPSAEGVR
jgi:hypothetical protein